MTPKEKLNKLISHTLVNLYNRAEPINDKWINEVKFALEDFNKEKLKEQQKENDKLRSLLLTKDLGYFDFTTEKYTEFIKELKAKLKDKELSALAKKKHINRLPTLFGKAKLEKK